MNETFGQKEASQKVSDLAAFVGLPGITEQCRNAGLTMNCGEYFPDCRALPGTEGKTLKFH